MFSIILASLCCGSEVFLCHQIFISNKYSSIVMYDDNKLMIFTRLLPSWNGISYTSTSRL